MATFNPHIETRPERVGDAVTHVSGLHVIEFKGRQDACATQPLQFRILKMPEGQTAGG